MEGAEQQSSKTQVPKTKTERPGLHEYCRSPMAWQRLARQHLQNNGKQRQSTESMARKFGQQNKHTMYSFRGSIGAFRRHRRAWDSSCPQTVVVGQQKQCSLTLSRSWAPALHACRLAASPIPALPRCGMLWPLRCLDGCAPRGRPGPRLHE
jgi:hypothetical protein